MFKDITILYAEDEDFIRNNIVEILEFMQIHVIAVSNGQEAYEAYLLNKPDIVISDIEMPLMNGLELASKIRQTDDETPIIVTTAYTDTKFLLKAVELKLTKYILKPIVLMDLKEALTAGVKNTKCKSYFSYFDENCYYDLKKHKLFIEEQEKKLDFHERQLLELLLKYPNEIVTYEQMEVLIWEDGASSAAIRSLVRNLRQKLPENTIENISKTGYKIVTKQ